MCFLALLAIEHVRSDLNPLSHQISEYAVGADQLMTFAFASWIVALLALAVAAGRQGRRSEALLWIGGVVGVALTALFETQTVAGRLPAGVEYAISGRLHDVGSGAASLAIASAAAYWIIMRGEGWRFAAFLLAASVSGSVVLLAVGPEVGGLRQRMLVLAGCAWQLRRAAVAVH